jgi:hypothetical protein
MPRVQQALGIYSPIRSKDIPLAIGISLQRGLDVHRRDLDFVVHILFLLRRTAHPGVGHTRTGGQRSCHPTFFLQHHPIGVLVFGIGLLLAIDQLSRLSDRGSGVYESI